MDQHGLIAPILALVLWTLVIWIWMFATPAAASMSKIGATNRRWPPDRTTRKYPQ